MRRHALVFALTVVSLAHTASSPSLWAQDLLDLADPGAAGRSTDRLSDLSRDGRYLAFASTVPGLVPGDGSEIDVFVRDLELGTIERITNDQRGFVRDVHISPDGRFVVYSAWILAPIPAGVTRESFRHDRVTHTTTQVAPGWFFVRVHDVSSDGRYVLVTAKAQASVPDFRRVLRYDCLTGAVEICSRNAAGQAVFCGSQPEDLSPVMDDSGARVAFVSSFEDHVPNSPPMNAQAYVLDVPSGVFTRASLGTNGQHGDQPLTGTISMSSDGRFVAFATRAQDLVAGDTNWIDDVFVRDLALGTTILASRDTLDLPLTDRSTNPVISADGSHLAFETRTLTSPISPAKVRVRDLILGVTWTIDSGPGLVPDRLQPVTFARDDRRVLVHRWPANDGVSRVQMVDFGAACALANFCASTPNSTGQAASLSAQGTASREANDLVFAAHHLPLTAVALLYSGTSAIDPGTPFGDGLQCAGGTIVRHSIQQAVAGAVSDAQDLLAPEYASVQPGDTRYYQVLYRDPAAGGAGFNTTDALAVTFCW